MHKNQKGFSLVELIVVVGILGILAAIAIPAYTGYRDKAYRAAAKAALLESAQNMERLFTRTNRYDGASIGMAANNQILQWTEGQKYQLSAPVLTQTTFTLRATPSFTEGKCGYLEITQTGAKSSQIAGNCW